MSFHMQKTLLGLQRNYFFLGRGEGKAIWRIVRTSEKTLASPLYEVNDMVI